MGKTNARGFNASAVTKTQAVAVVIVILVAASAVGAYYLTLPSPKPSPTPIPTPTSSYVVVDTGQTTYYDNTGEIKPPAVGDPFYGQDAQHDGVQLAYRDNGDGTVTDLNTGLMWQQTLFDNKMTYEAAKARADAFTLAGYDDWRLPTIKELYSLILFSGTDPPVEGTAASGLAPFIDTEYFEFRYGDTRAGERIIDVQYASSTEYVHTTMTGDFTVFGVNFADGRIKGYGTTMPGNREKTFEVRCVRGNLDYGKNDFEDNGNGTVTDHATGLMWTKRDSEEGMTWDDALAWVQQKNTEKYLGYNDWRLPNAKELQSIVDYTRSPDTTASAAIDPVFTVTAITNAGGEQEFPFYWTGTTHARFGGQGAAAVYVSFGRALGWMGAPGTGEKTLLDVHGAGAQRSDPKTGNPEDYPYGRGPQGDVIRIYNHVRCVRDIGDLQGYTLFAPLQSTTTYLIDHSGRSVQTWESDYIPGNAVYLLETGNLLRTASPRPRGNQVFHDDRPGGLGGAGGRVQEITWDGTVVWDFEYSSDQHLLHHDIESLPNGNVLMIAWEYKTAQDAIAAGRNPNALTDGELWPDHIIEVEPTGPSGGDIVWEWHVWDHLIQEYDPTQSNYGVVQDHPERIDINFVAAQGPNPGGADWNHINSIDYNEGLDQILLSVHEFSEIWVIDHSTTSDEAAGHTGGNSGKGGDLLYRWGNPKTYRGGNAVDQTFFKQHDAQWVEAGLSGAGNILVFNNGPGRPDGGYSSVDEFTPPVDRNGTYSLTPGSAYGPEAPVWRFTAENLTAFYSQSISGAQRLPNGNTLICNGDNGRFFEVTAEKAIVWEYVNPFPNADQNIVFKAHRYAKDYPGFTGKDLT